MPARPSASARPPSFCRRCIEPFLQFLPIFSPLLFSPVILFTHSVLLLLPLLLIDRQTHGHNANQLSLSRPISPADFTVIGRNATTPLSSLFFFAFGHRLEQIDSHHFNRIRPHEGRFAKISVKSWRRVGGSRPHGFHYVSECLLTLLK